MNEGREHRQDGNAYPTIDIKTQIALSDAILSMADLFIDHKSAEGLTALDRATVSLISHMSDAEVSFIALSEYLDFAAACIRDGDNPHDEPSTVQERHLFEQQLSAARKLT